MIISYHKDFKKSYKKFPSKIKLRFEERILIFEEDEFDPILNNHALKGKYLGYRSINLNGDIRAIYKTENNIIIFAVIGSHSNLYG